MHTNSVSGSAAAVPHPNATPSSTPSSSPAAASANSGKPDQTTGHGNGTGNGPKYQVNVDGTLYPWNADTITVPQIRELGNLPPGDPVQLIDLETNDARTLGESEIVTVKPGMGFAKKVKFQRG